MKAPPTVEEVYQGVAAPSRLKVDDAAAVTEMPKVGFPLFVQEHGNLCRILLEMLGLWMMQIAAELDAKCARRYTQCTYQACFGFFSRCCCSCA